MERFKPHTYTGETPEDKEYMSNTKGWLKRGLDLILNQADSRASVVAEAKSSLEQLDETVLSEIILSHLGKSGLDIRKFPGLGFDDVLLHKKATSRMNKRGGAGLHSQRGIEIDLQEFLDDKNELEEKKLFHAVLHEILHRLSSIVPEHSRKMNWKLVTEDKLVHKSGISKTIQQSQENIIAFGLLDKDSIEQENDYLNEGMTEILTQEMSDEYYKRIGENRADKKIREQEYRFSDYDRYTENITSVYYMMIYFSLILDVPESVVKSSFTRAFFRNGSISPLDMLEDFSPEQQDIIRDSFSALKVTDLTPAEFDPGIDVQFGIRQLVEYLPEEKQVEFEARIEVLRKSYRETSSGKAMIQLLERGDH